MMAILLLRISHDRWSKMKRRSNGHAQFQLYLYSLALFDRKYIHECFEFRHLNPWISWFLPLLNSFPRLGNVWNQDFIIRIGRFWWILCGLQANHTFIFRLYALKWTCIHCHSRVMFAMKSMNICNDQVNYDKIIIQWSLVFKHML